MTGLDRRVTRLERGRTVQRTVRSTEAMEQALKQLTDNELEVLLNASENHREGQEWSEAEVSAFIAYERAAKIEHR